MVLPARANVADTAPNHTSGLLEKVKPFGPSVQCTQVIEGNVTFGPYCTQLDYEARALRQNYRSPEFSPRDCGFRFNTPSLASRLKIWVEVNFKALMFSFSSVSSIFSSL